MKRAELTWGLLVHLGYNLWCDQVPTAGNSRNPRALANMVAFCRREIAPARLKGFLMSTWRKMDPDFERVQENAGDLVAEVREIMKGAGA